MKHFFLFLVLLCTPMTALASATWELQIRDGNVWLSLDGSGSTQLTTDGVPAFVGGYSDEHYCAAIYELEDPVVYTLSRRFGRYQFVARNTNPCGIFPFDPDMLVDLQTGRSVNVGLNYTKHYQIRGGYLYQTYLFYSEAQVKEFPELLPRDCCGLMVTIPTLSKADLSAPWTRVISQPKGKRPGYLRLKISMKSLFE